MRQLLTETKLQTETMLQDDKVKTAQAAKGELQAAKGELQAAKGELQAAEAKLQAAEAKLQAAEIKWTNCPSDDHMKGFRLDQVKTCQDQVKACQVQVGAWGDRVSTILNQVSGLEVMRAPAGITHVVCSHLPLSQCCFVQIPSVFTWFLCIEITFFCVYLSPTDLFVSGWLSDLICLPVLSVCVSSV